MTTLQIILLVSGVALLGFPKHMMTLFSTKARRSTLDTTEDELYLLERKLKSRQDLTATEVKKADYLLPQYFRKYIIVLRIIGAVLSILALIITLDL